MTEQIDVARRGAGDDPSAAIEGGGTAVASLWSELDELRRQLTAETERREAAEAALHESEAHYRHTIELLPHVLWTAEPGGHGLALDPTAAARTRKATEQALGRGWLATIHPDDRQRTADAAARSRDTGEPYELRHRVQMPNGSYRWVQSRALPRRDENGKIIRWYGTSLDIHDQIVAEEQLRESEENYRYAIELSPQIPWTADPEGKAIDVGPRWLERTGMTREETLGFGWGNALHPEDVEASFEYLLPTFAKGGPVDARYRLRQHDGSYRWYRSRAYARRDATGAIIRWYGLSEDIQEQVEAEEALRANETRLRLALEAGQLTSWDWNLETDQVIWHGNDHYLLGFDVDGNSMTQKAWAERVHPDDRPVVMQTLATAMKTRERYSFEYRVVGANGEVAWVSSTARADYDADGKPVRMVGVLQDITERKKGEADLRRAQDDLLRMSRLGAMGAMASTLAHELNQPLTAASTYMAACRRRLAQIDADGPLVEGIDRAIAEALRAGEIIRRARRFTISGEITRRPEDLGTIIDDALATVGKLEVGDGMAKRFELRHGEARVLVDRIQIEQVLTNIIRNAAEAMAGRPRRQLHVASRLDGSMVELRIADTGPGLPPDRLAELFLPFATSKPNGTGLGLPICRTIVEAHGGRIWAEPPGDDGAVFVLTLPAAADPAA